MEKDRIMEASARPKCLFTNLRLDQLKIMYRDKLSPRQLACAVEKYDLLKLLWKESQIEDCYFEKYKINNIDEISRHDDAFSRHLLGSSSSCFTGQNEYAIQRQNDSIQQTCFKELSRERLIEEKKFKIHDLIRSDIGTKWREFGRHLYIKEGKLDSIDVEQREVCRKVDEIFKTFDQQNLDEYSYIDKVCNALVKSRRKDLSKKVMRIMEDKPI